TPRSQTNGIIGRFAHQSLRPNLQVNRKAIIYNFLPGASARAIDHAVQSFAWVIEIDIDESIFMLKR
uniref:Uncharacterized protein n=1 Tax=Romanomermis culicivorax TaxID=13658 RepID=A0A915JPN8_ROMCU